MFVQYGESEQQFYYVLCIIQRMLNKTTLDYCTLITGKKKNDISHLHLDKLM